MLKTNELAEHKPIIAIIGLGYVGLPLAVEFGKQYQVVGFDINNERIDKLLKGEDETFEVSKNELTAVIKNGIKGSGITFTTESGALSGCNIKIITVPTPVDQYNNPDLSMLINATKTVAQVLNCGDLVIYESTVYPGCTEEVCVPVLEKYSGLKFNVDFFCGYSPERINPGDKVRTLPNIKKITSGSTPASAEKIDCLYRSIIPAGTYLAPSIKVAEAAKVIENAQRDINIAFVNELSKIFSLLEIDTHAVLKAASTKWNFLNFKPGLVGGHCIGVDPYYLAQRSAAVGYYPEIILSGRRINDGMGTYVAGEVLKLMIQKGINVCGSEILILGITFKENCPDIRNTKVIDVVKELQKYKASITVHDPWIDFSHIKREYNVDCLQYAADEKKYDAVILAVGHQDFIQMDCRALLKAPGVVYDVKGILEASSVDGRL